MNADDMHRMQSLRVAAEAGDHQSQCALASLLDSCATDNAQRTEAATWYEMAAKQGNGRAQYMLGLFHLTHGNLQDAAYWLRKAADNTDGHVWENKLACEKLARLHMQGDGVEVDFARAAELLEKAESHYSLGLLYLAGQGVPKNVAEAARLFRLSAEEGDFAAIDSLALCQQEGAIDAVEVRQIKAKMTDDEQLREAESGNVEAQLCLGHRYKLGIGVPQNHALSFSWFHKAAIGGSPFAQLQVSICYLEGEGVTKDLIKSIDWADKAAGNRYTEAEVRLADYFYNGIGVHRDYDWAAVLYRRAADMGHVDAQVKLGVCYLKGLGVDEDEIEAYAYLYAAKDSSPIARQYLLVARSRLSIAEEDLANSRAQELCSQISARIRPWRETDWLY